MMKIEGKGLLIVVAALLMLAVIVPVYALGEQSGNMQQKRDQECTPECPATRAYGEDPPVKAQEETPEALTEEVETPIQDQTQAMEQLREGDCENEDCEQNQFQFQYQFQDKYRCGQDED